MKADNNYELLFHASLDAIARVDYDFNIIEANNQFVALFKYPLDALIGKNCSELFPNRPEREAILDKSRQILEGKSVRYEDIRHDARGHAHHVLITGIPIIEEASIVGAFFIYKDMTSEHKAYEALHRQVMIFESLFKNSSDAIVRIDTDQHILEVNENFEKFFGYSNSEVLGKRPDILFSKTDELDYNIGLTNTLLEGQKVVLEGVRYAKDGTGYDFLVQGVPIIAGNEVIGGFGIYTNITEQKKAAKKLANQKMIFEALFKNSSDAILRFGTNHKIIEINENFTHLFGYTLAEISDQDLDDVILRAENSTTSKEITNRVLQGEVITLEDLRYNKNGNAIHMLIKGIPIFSGEHVIGGYGLYTDISERKTAEREILYISYHDQLTGLYNRRYFEEEMRRVDNERHFPVSIIMADVNGLKLTNDAFGHAMGDALLRRMGEIITANCRSGELIARLGGDEFVILLPNTTAESAEEIVQRIKRACNEEAMDNISLSMSYGCDSKLRPDEPMSNLFKRVEDFMYRHKLVESPSFRGKLFETIIKTLHEKNKREERHSSRVSTYCEAIGIAMNLNTREINELKTAGWLHDIGKIAISESILNKEGKLDHQEWTEIRKHPEIGYRILSSVPEMAELANGILAHHERFDGKGYPKGLSGHDIPALARIIGVADAYDAMTTSRTYRAVRTKDEAIDELLKNSGAQFDPYVVGVFVHKVLKG